MKGALKQVHSPRNVLATDGVGKAKVALSAASERRPWGAEDAVFEDFEGQCFARHAWNLDLREDVN